MTRDRLASVRSDTIAVQVVPEMPALVLGVDVSTPLGSYAAQCSRGYLFAKRALDVAVSLTLLVLLTPLLAIVALLVRCTSRGPVFVRQTRVGEGGRLFVMYNFRSMYRAVDDSLHQRAYQRFPRGQGSNGKLSKDTLANMSTPPRRPLVASRPAPLAFAQPIRWRARALPRIEDPRITPVGVVIRATNMDKLPQLFNVLIGDMSLVGPRPPIPYEVRLYRREHLQRLSARPGLTGYWQVYGRDQLSFEKMVDMDLAYIQRRTFWLDLKLMIRTPIAMLNAHDGR